METEQRARLARCQQTKASGMGSVLEGQRADGSQRRAQPRSRPVEARSTGGPAPRPPTARERFVQMSCSRPCCGAARKTAAWQGALHDRVTHDSPACSSSPKTPQGTTTPRSAPARPQLPPRPRPRRNVRAQPQDSQELEPGQLHAQRRPCGGEGRQARKGQRRCLPPLGRRETQTMACRGG